jgi:hypothetical protein
MRKGVDTLLFSGDFTPTTFNLAFFMHSLFRDDIDRETKLLKEETGVGLPRIPHRRREERAGHAAAHGRPRPAAAIAAAGAAAASAPWP